MSLEIEKRFKNFDYGDLKKKLTQLGFKKTGSYLQRMRLYQGRKPDQSIRVRVEGNKTTLTVKKRNIDSYETEWEVEVSSYSMMKRILKQLGLVKRYDLEKYRETYLSPDHKTNVVFDHFPGLPPYIEVESQTEADLFKVMSLLGLSEEGKFAASDLYFACYGIVKTKKEQDLTFQNADTVFSGSIQKRKSTFMKLLDQQRKHFLP